MEQQNSIFRQKNLDRVSSPEQLNDYIRVTTPSVWIVLIAVVLLLIGAVIWGVFGRMEIHDASGQTVEVAPITFVTN